jgi:hypothetical protein
MPGHRSVVAAPQRIVEETTEQSLFGSAPLIEGEDQAVYDAFLASISAAVNPKDVLEQIWVRDGVDLTWETRRMRRLKASLLTSKLSRGLQQVLVTVMDEVQAGHLAGQCAARDRGAIKEVEKLLAAMGLTMEVVMARTLSADIDAVERIDRMVMSAEVRRNAALREIERHRSCIAEALRRTTDDVVDAEFEDVAPAAPAQEAAPAQKGGSRAMMKKNGPVEEA